MMDIRDTREHDWKRDQKRDKIRDAERDQYIADALTRLGIDPETNVIKIGLDSSSHSKIEV